MTILQILQIVAAMAGAAKDISGIVDDLRAQGHPDDAPIPQEHAAKIVAILDGARESYAQQFIDRLGA